MNLAQTLASRGIESASVSKADEMASSYMLSDEQGSLDCSYGIGGDSFNFGIQEITPPKDTTQVENPGTAYDKKRRKSKAFRKYETQLQKNNAVRKVLVQTAKVSNENMVDVYRTQGIY